MRRQIIIKSICGCLILLLISACEPRRKLKDVQQNIKSPHHKINTSIQNDLKSVHTIVPDSQKIEKPDCTLRHCVLTAEPLASLRMGGSVIGARHRWALVESVQGVLIPVSVGDYIGHHYDIVRQITPLEITIYSKSLDQSIHLSLRDEAWGVK